MTRANRFLLATALLGLAWALTPLLDHALSLRWAATPAMVLAQAWIWVIAGRVAAAWVRPRLSLATFGFFAVATVGAGLNRWLIQHAGGAILVGPASGQVLHAALAISVGVAVGLVLRGGMLKPAPHRSASRLQRAEGHSEAPGARAVTT